MKKLSLLCLMLLGLVVLGCDSGQTVEVPDNPAPVTEQEGETAVAPDIPEMPSDPGKAN